MTQVTVAAGKKLVIADGCGNYRTYVAGDQPYVPTADAAKFIAAGLCAAV